jgi:hypothetical protein
MLSLMLCAMLQAPAPTAGPGNKPKGDGSDGDVDGGDGGEGGGDGGDDDVSAVPHSLVLTRLLGWWGGRAWCLVFDGARAWCLVFDGARAWCLVFDGARAWCLVFDGARACRRSVLLTLRNGGRVTTTTRLGSTSLTI